VTATRHLLLAVLGGVAAGLAAGFLSDPIAGLLVAWGVAAGVFLVLTWASVWWLDATEAARVASSEDPSWAVRDILLLLIAAASLVAVALVIVPAERTGYGHLSLGIGCIIASWLVVHTVFALKYARMYYEAPHGGIDFKQEEPPTYRDFAYVAFTVGMTFQVADTDTQNTAMRLTVLRQALISFLFGAIILAVTVNVVAGLTR
jgi:uncharacterized membrane protein